MINSLDNIQPVVAILRGVKPSEVLEIAAVLVKVGFEAIEVPLNSPEPLESIGLLANAYGKTKLIGAGTVTSVAEVQAIHAVGGRLIVSPNTDADVIKATKKLGMVSVPGCLTPTEAFTALQAGADALKFFPAGSVSPGLFKALGSVLPQGIALYAVGGVDETNMHEYADLGITGFGLGSSVYKPGKSLDAIAQSAKAGIATYKQIQSRE